MHQQGNNLADSDILREATRFRSALDEIDPVHWHNIYIDHFPRGACGHCSELLGRHLRDTFEITADHVCRVFYAPDGQRETSHAWLEWNGLIIDISGDQFGWEPVIVSRSSTHHDRGEDEERHALYIDPVWWGQQCAGVWNAAIAILNPPATP